MANPEGLNTTTLHGRYVMPDDAGTPLQGTVTFTPNPAVITFVDQKVIVAGTETVTLDSSGEFTITLIATDTTNENPTGWLYTVSEKLIGLKPRSYNISLPYNAGVTVELATITPTDAAPTYTPVVGPQGAPGVVTTVNGYSAATITLAASDVGAIATTARGAANGVASLDASSLVPVAQLPDLSGTYLLASKLGAASGAASLDASSHLTVSQLNLAASAPPSVGAGAVGTSSSPARADHTHDGVDLTTAQTVGGAKTWSADSRFNGFVGVGVAPGGARANVQSSVDEIVALLQQTVANPTNPVLRLVSGASGDMALGIRVSVDTTARLGISTGGTVSFGPGNAATDVTLYRSAASNLNVGGQLNIDTAAPTAASHATRKDYVDTNFSSLAGAQTITGNKTFSGSSTFSGAASFSNTVGFSNGAVTYTSTNPSVTRTNSTHAAFQAQTSGDTTPRYQINADGSINFGPGNGAADVILKRALSGSSPVLSNNVNYQSLLAASTAVAFNALVTADTYDRWRAYGSGLMEWGSGAAARDVNLYRSSAGNLKTDQNLIVGGTLSILGVGQTATAYKPADTSRTNTTTLTQDPDLVFNMPANTVWVVEGFMCVNGSTTGDFKMGFITQTGTTFVWHNLASSSAATSGTSGPIITDVQSASSTLYNMGTIANTNGMGGQIKGMLFVGATAGTFALQWSQNAADATNATILMKGSYLTVTRVA